VVVLTQNFKRSSWTRAQETRSLTLYSSWIGKILIPVTIVCGALREHLPGTGLLDTPQQVILSCLWQQLHDISLKGSCLRARTCWLGDAQCKLQSQFMDQSVFFTEQSSTIRAVTSELCVELEHRNSDIRKKSWPFQIVLFFPKPSGFKNKKRLLSHTKENYVRRLTKIWVQ
jgi:hypothetical protein